MLISLVPASNGQHNTRIQKKYIVFIYYNTQNRKVIQTLAKYELQNLNKVLRGGGGGGRGKGEKAMEN
jgi:cytoplasmic iron level regulating protein YaaA (DUF328/UPF0246 family)